MTNEFKKGDKVKIIEDNYDHQHLIGMIGKVVMCEGSDIYHVDFGKEIEQSDNEVNKTTRKFDSEEMELYKGKGVVPKVKLKEPTHIVVWEEDTDPCKFFTSEPEAKNFIKELSERSDVVKESIVLVEIKSCKKAVVRKSVTFAQHKI